MCMCRVSRDDVLTGGEAVAPPPPPQLPPSVLLGALYGFWDGRIRFVRAASPRDSAAVAGGVVSSSQEAVARFFSQSDRNGDGGGTLDLEGYEPVSSRGGVIVLRRARVSSGGGGPQQAPSDLCICDPVSCRRIFLPRPGIHDEAQVILFSGGDRGGGGHRPQMIMHVVNLELLRHKVLQVQTFSPETNAWGPVVATHAHLPPSSFIRPVPLVVGGAAYWLCVSNAADLGCYVLALRVDGSSRPAQIELPPRSQLGRVSKPSVEMLLVWPSSPADGKLGLAVARRHEISIWTLSSSPSPSPSKNGGAARWTRRAVVDLARVAESAAPEEMLPPLTADEEVRLECFAERSGAVLFRLYHGCLFELSLATMEVRFIGYYSKRDMSSMCAYDMDSALLNR